MKKKKTHSSDKNELKKREREIIQLIPPTNSRTKIIIDFQMMRTCSLVLSFVCVHLLCMFVPFASCRSMIRHGNRDRFFIPTLSVNAHTSG
jgi:hypothetical protein